MYIHNEALEKPANRSRDRNMVRQNQWHGDSGLAVDENWMTDVVLAPFRQYVGKYWQLKLMARPGETVQYIRLHRDNESGKDSCERLTLTLVYWMLGSADLCDLQY